MMHPYFHKYRYISSQNIRAYDDSFIYYYSFIFLFFQIVRFNEH